MPNPTFQVKEQFYKSKTKLVKLTQVAKNQFGFATAILWH
jgi:hypothetical protein